MKHLLLSGFSPVRISRVEETTSGGPNVGFFYSFWRRWRWFNSWSSCFVSYSQCSFNRLSKRGELCRCAWGALRREGGGYCFIQYSSSSFNPLFDGEG